MANAIPLAAFFDPLPDPRLVSEVIIRSSGGRVWEIRIRPCVEPCTFHYAYARNVFAEVHRDLFERSDTRVLYMMQLHRPVLFALGEREQRKTSDVLAPMAAAYRIRFWHARGETRRGPIFNVFIFIESGAGTAHLWPALRQRVAHATSSRVVRQRTYHPGEHIDLAWDAYRREYRIVVLQHPLREISWKSVFPRALSIVLALAPLRLPPYVVLWILQWIPVFGTQRELRLLRLVENVTRRCAALAGHRLACVGKGLRKRARQ